MNGIYELQGVDFMYPSGRRKVLNDVTLSVREGEVLSILGPNGAGKSTLLNCMLKLLKITGGRILLRGKPIEQCRAKEIAAVVGYVPQSMPVAFPYTVEDFVLMGRASRVSVMGKPTALDREKAQEAIALMGLERIKTAAFTELSGGEQQQVAIARAIAAEPQVILFDEPTSHLDFGNQLKTLRMVKQLCERGFAVVMTTHNPDHALLLGHRAALLDREGRLTSGPTDEVVTEEKLKAVYEADLKIRFMEEEKRRVCIYPAL
ncbi:MAG: ABC transporter ATP-binding protein [Clostridia bacterium]|nr:ABC transporter ATP-binding protein [Clostridia bacterium]